MNPVRVADATAAAAEAADRIVAAGREAIAARGVFSLAMSGGRTPWQALELLVDSDLDWSRTALFQVDERVAPAGSPERNLTRIILALPLAHHGSIRPMPVGAEDLEEAAREYGRLLPDRLDLVHLGLGADGHTASLVPGDPVLDVDDRPVAVTETAYQGTRRMTLTFPAIERAREVLFLVTGEEKQAALAGLLAGDTDLPAARVRNDRVTLVTDLAADPA